MHSRIFSTFAEFADSNRLHMAELEAENLAILEAIPKVQAEIEKRRQTVAAAAVKVRPFVSDLSLAPRTRVAGEEPVRQLGGFISNGDDPRLRFARLEVREAEALLNASLDRLNALRQLRGDNLIRISDLATKIAEAEQLRNTRRELISGPTRPPRLRRAEPAAGEPGSLDPTLEERKARRESRTAAARERGELGGELEPAGLSRAQTAALAVQGEA